MIDTRGTPFEEPLRKLREAKSAGAHVAPHRSVARAQLGACELAVAACLTLALWGALLAAQPFVMDFWRACIAFWLEALGYPLGPLADGGGIAPMLAPIVVDEPTTPALWTALGVTSAAWFLAGRLQGPHLPLRVLLRCLCALLLLSVLVFLLLPGAFTYALGEHAGDQLANGYRCLLVFPFMLGSGYYLFQERIALKVFYSLAIAGYFVAMIPHKVVLHVILLHAGSRLAMPLLYVCLGSAFDILAFVALYAWALSNLPPQRHGL